MAGVIFALGLTTLVLSAIMFCFGLVDLLHWATLPSRTDPAGFPLWACYALVAAVLAVGGVIVAQLGRVKFMSTASFHNPVTELMRERAP